VVRLPALIELQDGIQRGIIRQVPVVTGNYRKARPFTVDVRHSASIVRQDMPCRQKTAFIVWGST